VGDGRILARTIVDAQKLNVGLKRAVGQHPKQVQLSLDLLGHEIQDQDPKLANILHLRLARREIEDVLITEGKSGRE